MHLNFCLCMIIPKGSNQGFIAQKLCYLQNMLQMTTSALETDLYPLPKIVSHSQALLSGDVLNFGCNCSLEFTNCLKIVLIHIFLQIPSQLKIWVLKSMNEVHISTTHISLSCNYSLSYCNVEVGTSFTWLSSDLFYIYHRL